MSEKSQYLIVNADVLPDVFTKVIEAKQLLSKAQAKILRSLSDRGNFPECLLQIQGQCSGV